VTEVQQADTRGERPQIIVAGFNVVAGFNIGQ
jgi:hypothetical protein